MPLESSWRWNVKQTEMLRSKDMQQTQKCEHVGDKCIAGGYINDIQSIGATEGDGDSDDGEKSHLQSIRSSEHGKYFMNEASVQMNTSVHMRHTGRPTHEA